MLAFFALVWSEDAARQIFGVDLTFLLASVRRGWWSTVSSEANETSMIPGHWYLERNLLILLLGRYNAIIQRFIWSRTLCSGLLNRLAGPARFTGLS